MTQPQTVMCPGCGLTLPAMPGLAPYFHASAECWALYGDLAVVTLSLADPAYPHQHAVDAYEAQHIGSPTKPVTAVLALVGLCLALEHGASGRQVQRAHLVLARKHPDWPALMPRARSYPVTVRDVLETRGDEARLRVIKAWMESAWAGWAHEHARIRALAADIHTFER